MFMAKKIPFVGKLAELAEAAYQEYQEYKENLKKVNRLLFVCHVSVEVLQASSAS